MEVEKAKNEIMQAQLARSDDIIEPMRATKNEVEPSAGTKVNPTVMPLEVADMQRRLQKSVLQSEKVLIRIRPLSDGEKVSQGSAVCLSKQSARELVWLGQPISTFQFDHIFSEATSQEEFFRGVGIPMVDNCLAGYNGCIMSYGQTSSGKTYTMVGDISWVDGKLGDNCGIVPRTFELLFKRIREEEDSTTKGQTYTCKCSYLEIYNEQIYDLLGPSRSTLQLREDMQKHVCVENLVEYSVSSIDDVMRLLLEGDANRKKAATNMSIESSRSHSIVSCVIDSRVETDSITQVRCARLNLVDLAGTERQKKSRAEGDRLKEAANINKSLTTLGLVIRSLVNKQRFVPYRNSKLTFLLQDSLGGNSKTTFIANVSPALCSANETLSTLQFAQSAKLIQNKAKANEFILKQVPQTKLRMEEVADKNMPVALEVCKESKTTSEYSEEQKKKEIEFLNLSIEDLEYTVAAQERKVCVLQDEVERLKRMAESPRCNLGTSSASSSTSRDSRGRIMALQEKMIELNLQIKQYSEKVPADIMDEARLSKDKQLGTNNALVELDVEKERELLVSNLFIAEQLNKIVDWDAALKLVVDATLCSEAKQKAARLALAKAEIVVMEAVVANERAKQAVDRLLPG